jgi:hypothetical protein
VFHALDRYIAGDMDLLSYPNPSLNKMLLGAIFNVGRDKSKIHYPLKVKL